ncbi:Sugar transporter STL1 [Fusarium odoratissimum]|uniref:Sugar transporter STL1 n=1 Tax=Fusarium oxysporum f. sp. cubense (strain race 4) TaxID=2502994 RepID=N1RLF1_FUSC4|nr:Sugar transporter STL1 [Fusarium odoratissimum]
MTLFGYYQGVFSGVVVTQDFLKLHNLVGPTKTNVLATVTAIYDIGCFVGAVIALTIGEKLGRKKVIIVGTVIMSIGTIIKVTSYSLPQMIVGRVVLGWLISHGRTQEATEILACIEDKPTTSPVVTSQLHEIQYSVDYELQHAVKWKDILLRRNKDTADTKALRRLLLGANTQLMQQFGGINIMSYYMPTVLINSVGLSESSRITNFIVVEITPIGIQNLGWRFWIVWTVTNALFLPVIYFLYPETCKFSASSNMSKAYLFPANRKLEDMDDYFRENPSVMVIRDNDAIATKRPEKYIQREQEDIQREEAKDGSPVVGVGHEEKGLREQGNF